MNNIIIQSMVMIWIKNKKGITISLVKPTRQTRVPIRHSIRHKFYRPRSWNKNRIVKIWACKLWSLWWVIGFEDQTAIGYLWSIIPKIDRFKGMYEVWGLGVVVVLTYISWWSMLLGSFSYLLLPSLTYDTSALSYIFIQQIHCAQLIYKVLASVSSPLSWNFIRA